MKVKKLLALFISLSMILSCIPSQAALVDDNNGKAQYVAVFLEADSSASGIKYKEVATDPTEANEGDTFLIGIKATNMKNIEEIASEYDDTAEVQYWMVDLSFGITYDPTVLTLEPTARGTGNLTTSILTNAVNTRLVGSPILEKDSGNYQHSVSVNTKDADTQGLTTIFVSYTSGDAVDDGHDITVPIPDETYLAIFEFKVAAEPESADPVIGFSSSETDQYLKLWNNTEDDGVGYQGENDPTSDTDIYNVINFDSSKLNIFKASGKVVTSIRIKSPNNYVPPTQYVGNSIDVGNLQLEKIFNNDTSDTADIDMSTAVSYKYADTLENITEANSTDLKEFVNDPFDPDDVDDLTGKKLYAISGTKAVYLGPLTVKAREITKIELVNDPTKTDFGTRQGGYVTTENIRDVIDEDDDEKITVKITYDDASVTPPEVESRSFSSYYIDLFIVDANGKLALVEDDTTFVSPTTEVYIAPDGSEGKTVAELGNKIAKVTASAFDDYMVIKSITPAAEDLKYGVGASSNQDVINFDDATIVYYSKSKGDNAQTNTTSTVGTIAKDQKTDNDVIYYLGTDAVAANNAYSSSKTKIESGTTQYTDALLQNGTYIWAVPKDKTDATPVLVGQLTNRAIDTTSSVIATNTTANPPQSVAYGKTLADARPKDQTTQDPKDLTVTLHYDNGDTETYTLAEAAAKGIKARIVSAGQTPTTLADNISNTTPLTTEMSGGKIQFYTGTAPNETVLAEATVPTITKATVKVQITSPTTNTTKVYDGGVALPSGASAGTIVFDGLTTTDDAKKANIAIEGLTFQYDEKDVPATANTRKIEAVVGQNGLSVKRADGKTAADISDDDIAALNNHYSFELDTGFTTANGKTTVDGATADITPLALTVNAPFPSAAIGDATAGKQEFVDGKTGTLVLSTSNSNIKTGDSVTLNFTYKYKAADIGSGKDPADVDLSNFSLTGNQSGNYLVTGSDADTTAVSIPATAKGKINNPNVERIAIHNNTLKTEYTYPDLGLDLSDLVLDVYFAGNSNPTEMNLATFLEKGTIALSQNKGGSANVGITDSNKASEELPYGQPTLTFTYNSDTQHALVSTLDVGKKPVSLKDLLELLQPTMTYDGTDEKTFTITSDELKALDPTLFEGDDEFEIEYTAKFASPDADNKVDITVNKIKPKSTDGDSDNYVIINDVTASADSKTPVDDNTTLTSATVKAATGDDFTGDIEPQPLDTPAAPTVTLSKSTNNITVDTPKSDASHTYQYSKDGGATWQTDPTFTDLAQDTEYTILVREVPQDGDKNHTYSETSSTKQKTYTYKVVAHRSGKSTTYTGYTNDTTVKSDADIHTIVNNGTKPSGFKAYYSDAATANQIAYSPTYAFAYVNKVADIYYTASSGGGGGSGGGVSTYTVKFDAADGGVISSGKSSVSVSSGSKVAETAVPAITAKTGYNFIGWSTDGSTVVDPTEATVTKSVTYTALYEEIVVPTNTPAPQPTDTPVIDENYTKPYASGYEDGTFRPDGQITRAELAAMIARLSYGDDLPSGSYYSSFSDVDSDAWFTKYVGYLEDKDVLSGYEDGTFRPYNPVTRGEISAVITRAQRLLIDVYTGQYTDVTDYDWARDYIQTLANHGIASGYEDGTFGPYNPLTRAEAVTMINKVLAPSEAVVTFTPNDIYGHWAYDQILLAVNERRLTSAPAPAPTEEPAVEPEATEEPAADEETPEVTEEAQDNTAEETTEEATDTTDETTEVVEEEGNSAE